MPALTYIDSNIFIRAFEGNDALAEALIDLFNLQPPDGFIPFATCELTLSELLVRPYKRHDDLDRLRCEKLIQPSNWLTVLPVDREVLAGAALVRSAYGLKLPDALHVSAAAKLRCKYFLTDDRGIRGNFQLRYSSPTQEWRSVEIDVLRPELSILAALPENWQS